MKVKFTQQAALKAFTVIFLFSMLFLSLAGCATPSQPAESGATRIRVTALPILETLPLYIAQQEGLFAKYGVEVEFIAAGSAPKRDEMIAAGQADAMVNEILSVMYFNREEPRVQVVRFARTATENAPLFRILVAANSGIQTLADLKGVEIGVSQGTVIEYVTERLLQQAGFSADEIKTLAVPDLGQRMALLGKGELKAAVLPDPQASLAMAQGAADILDDSAAPRVSFSVYTFRKEFIDQNPQAVKGFLAAFEEAVAMINEQPGGWGDVLAEKQLVPEPLRAGYNLPLFATAGVPDEAQWADALEWAQAKGLLAVDVDYSTSITPEFLP